MSKNQSAITKFKFQVLAYSGYILSTALTVKLCLALQSTGWSIVFGVILEGAKLSFGRNASRCWREGQPLKALSQGFLCFALIAVSLTASIGWFASAETQSRVSSPEFKKVQAAIELKERAASRMNNVAKAKNSLKATLALGAINTEIDILRGQLVSLETSESAIMTGSIDGALAKSLGLSSRMIRLGGYSVLALLLELITLLAFWEIDSFSNGNRGYSRLRTQGNADTGTKEGTDTRFSRVRDMINAGQFKGTILGIRAACKSINEPCGVTTAQRYQKELKKGGEALLKLVSEGKSNREGGLSHG